MRTIIVFVAIVCCCVVVSADDPKLIPPPKLTCTQVNYTNFDGTHEWESPGRYWADSQWGDNRSFLTYATNSPVTLMRITYGAPYGSTSELLTIKPWDQTCYNQQDNGVGSIYTYFVQFGQYMGMETINGIECYKWLAKVKTVDKSGQYYLWTVVDQASGFHIPVRHVSYESGTIGMRFATSSQMDFYMGTCSVQEPPDGTFATPQYCPALNVPFAVPPSDIPVAQPPKWKPHPPPGLRRTGL